MRIAITGASGFVGRHVLRELQSRSLDIIVAARSVDGFDADSRISSLVLIDVADFGESPFEKMGAPDILIHLAWSGLPNYQSRSHIETELPAQLAFLGSCIRGGLKRLVVAGPVSSMGWFPGNSQRTRRPILARNTEWRKTCFVVRLSIASRA